MRSLDLRRKQLKTLPKEIGQLKKLRILNLSYNPTLTTTKRHIQKLFRNQHITIEKST
ncbi:leucine rich repeat protein [Leptospira santarosai str. HAI821]|nr:leucine rich repeat protein [Leptospira santarosai str. HAI1349]EMO32012.1 leucine rich repeat protein [Leptospira santarosai str. HAI821]EMP80473.1 leucine rich repeat protein [Leptospira santarosai str. CBC1531]